MPMKSNNESIFFLPPGQRHEAPPRRIMRQLRQWWQGGILRIRRAVSTRLPRTVAILVMPLILALALLLAVFILAMCLLAIPLLYLSYWRVSRQIRKRAKKASDGAIEAEYWVEGDKRR